jgi:hypothetical protein
MSVSAKSFSGIVDDICSLRWQALSADDVVAVAWAYYFFSVQFRENLEIACELFPQDERLQSLRTGECDTDNLSPFPGIAAPDEKMHHDEFMRRLVVQTGLNERAAERLTASGGRYLHLVRRQDRLARAKSIASYEDGGLENVFSAMLQAPEWNLPGLPAFQHFLQEHIRFDSDPVNGHGALSRHLVADDRITPLWAAFRDMLIEAVPHLQHVPAGKVVEELLA